MASGLAGVGVAGLVAGESLGAAPERKKPSQSAALSR